MKIVKTAAGNKLKLSKTEWESIGKTTGWMRTAFSTVYEGEYKGHKIRIDEDRELDNIKLFHYVITPDGEELFAPISPYYQGVDLIYKWIDAGYPQPIGSNIDEAQLEQILQLKKNRGKLEEPEVEAGTSEQKIGDNEKSTYQRLKQQELEEKDPLEAAAREFLDKEASVDCRCPNCGDNLGKDRECPKDAFCSNCGKRFHNPRGYSIVKCKKCGLDTEDDFINERGICDQCEPE